MLQLNTLVRFIHSHSPARLSKFKKILARRPKSVPTPVITYTKKLCMVTAPVLQKKSDNRVYCAYSDY